MSQPEWMQKFKQIGLKSQEAVVSVDATSGEIVKTGETETSRFEKFDKPSRDSTANTTIPPWLQQQQQRKRASVLPPPKRPDAEQEEEDAAALFAAAGTKPVEVIARNEDDDAAALFAAAGSQPAIKVGVETDEENDDAAALFAAAGTATIPTGLSVEDEELADRYRRMLKMGMPEGAVVQKMNIDEVPSQIQDAVLKPAEETPTGLSAEDEEIAEKYRKMFKMGMPEGAVVQKMSIDEVPSHIQEAVLKPPEEAPVPTQTPAPVIDTFDTLSIEEEIIIEEVMDESIVEESMLAESVTGSQSTQTKAVEPSQDQASLPLEPSEQRMSDEDFGERWVVDKDRVLRDLNTTRFEEVEVSRDTGHVHYDEIYIDENGNEVVLRHRGKEAEPEEVQEIYVDEDGNTIDDDLLLEETEDIPPVQQSPSLVPSHVHTKEDPPSEQPLDPPSGLPLEPPHDPAYDVENQRKLLEREFKAYRSRMAWWVPYAFVFVIAGASILVLFFVVLADDDGIDVKSIPTAAPTPRDYIPLDPTNTGAIDVAATTPLEPVTGNCNFRGIEQPHVIDQCSCDGEITIVANDIRQRYESLLVNFLPDVIPDFDESLDSCDPKNQALIWLSSGTNNAGEAELYVRRERYALAYFYLDQGGVAWSDNGGWLSEEDTCQWDRATCDQDGRVVSLDITDNGIIGQLSIAISLMENLESFSAAQNKLEGTIPPEIFATTNLRSLDLSFNSIVGFVPPFPEDSALEIINFSSNNISGTIDSSIENVKFLASFNLASNAFTGVLPTEMFSLPLQELYLASNFFNGSIPDSIGGLSNLTALSLGPNIFSGDIPTAIGNLTNLTQLVIQDIPGLTGRLPASYGLQLTNLVEFVLRDTDVGGNIPQQFGMMTALELLDLGRNSLGRALPTELGMLTNLKTLKLENNAFTGSLPSELGNAVELEELQLQINQLIGTIPSSFGEMRQLSSLRLDANFLDGRAPTELCALRQVVLNEFTVDCPERVSDTLVVGVICSVPSCCTECF